MTDLEMTLLCAKALEVPLMGSGTPLWNPLHDDAQAMALVKRFHIHSEWSEGQHSFYVWLTMFWDYDTDKWTEIVRNADLNRAIVECVAQMQQAKP